MSLSNPSKTSPVSKYIKWQGSTGKFRYYDKSSEDNIELPTPLYIVPLDTLHKIDGYDDVQKKGMSSNEVHDLRSEELSVRYNGGSGITSGLYADIKGSLPRGWKYAQSVYAALIDPKTSDVELVNFTLSGSSVGPWIEAKVGDDGRVIVLDKNPDIQKKGTTQYYIPIVKKSEVRQDILDKCVEMDKTLQDYLYSPKNAVMAEIQKIESFSLPKGVPVNEDVKIDDLPF